MSFKNPIPYIFYMLFLVTPLVFTSKTSEVFEFNKIIIVYLATVLILFFWISQSVLNRKIIFRRTILDIPIALFLISQTLSTIFSADTRTSFLGYYSRFNGGLASSLAYSTLYFSYVTFMDKQKTLFALRLILYTGLIVAIWGILEHFGKGISCLLITNRLDTNCWVQDVQNRVFATLGQPNWLAAYLVALFPISNFQFLNTNWQAPLISNQNLKSLLAQTSKIFSLRPIFWLTITTIIFLAILFTKSRSGLIAFVFVDITFWTLTLITAKKLGFIKKIIFSLFIIHISLFISALFVGIPLTQNQLKTQELTLDQGTESGEIRKIVWKGAVNIWKNYPIFGTGVETFAFFYNNFRPVEHNLTSEWNFIYNKAHNEYLNYAATTGTVGLLAYLFLIGMIIWLIVKESGIMNQKLENKKNHSLSILYYSLLAGFVSILVTNFFGFSVVIISLLLFLFPAFAVSLQVSSLTAQVGSSKYQILNIKKLIFGQKLLLISLILTTFYLLLSIARYWYADTLYAQGRNLNDSGKVTSARETLLKAVETTPNEADYWIELVKSTTNLAIYFVENSELEKAANFASLALDEANRASNLSPKNIKIKKLKYHYFTSLANVNPSFLLKAQVELAEALKLAPTDASLYYLTGINNLNLEREAEAIKALEHAILIKPNYNQARLLLDKIKKALEN